MWYFTWILGVLLACAFGIINVIWLEVDEQFRREDEAERGADPGAERTGEYLSSQRQPE